MGLESATFINQLNALNPVGATDPKSQGDDHIRLIKSTLQASFPNIAGAMVRSHTELNAVGASGITGFAIPVNLVSLAALAAGVATTGLRSDAQFKIDEAIAPTWSATHKYTKNGSGSNTSALAIQAANAVLYLKSTTAAADRKNARVYSSSGAFVIDWQDDAESTFRDAIRATLNAGVTTLAFGNATDNTAFNFLGVGVLTINGSQSVVGNITTTGGRFLQSGDIGANASLSLQNTSAVDGRTSIAFTNNRTTSQQYEFGIDTSGGVTKHFSLRNLTAGTTPWLVDKTSGNITQTGVSLNPSGTSGAPSYSFSAEATLGWYRNAAGSLRASVNADIAEILAAASGGMKVADYGGTLRVVGSRERNQNSQSGNYTTVIGDAGLDIIHPNGAGAGDTFTIAANASVPYPIGTLLGFVNRDPNALSIAITTDTMFLAGTTTSGTRTLAQNGEAVAKKVEVTVWLISGLGLS